MKINLKNIAFTMAEMMMVMAIIGATAALTIPNLVDSYKEEQTIVKLKKAQEDLNRAYKSAILKYGEMETWGSLSQKQGNSRLIEFLKGSPCKGTACVSFINNAFEDYELEDGTVVSFPSSETSSFNGSFTTEVLLSAKTYTPGKNVFRFFLYSDAYPYSLTCTTGSNMTYPKGIFVPDGYCQDRNIDTNAFTGSGLSTSNWAVFNGNLDYLKCNDLNWETKTTCD